VKHAGPRALDTLEPLLTELRAIPGIRERKRGIFYRGTDAFLHFHEDAAGLFADLKRGSDFERMRVNTPREATRLLRIARAMAASSAR
jgi:hypothetical protein